MQFVDLKKQYLEYKDEIDSAMAEVVANTSFINGPAVKELEAELCAFSGAGHAIGCSNGSEAILLALMALDVKPGDEIIVPAFTYFASASMIPHAGAVPVFVDVDPVTFNIDPELLASKITDKTVGIIAVSLYGQVAEMKALSEFAKKNGLWLMEDAAQSFGAEQHGQKSCTFATVSTTSFFPAKPLGCFGDGGAIFTEDPVLAKKIKQLVNHGQESRYYHTLLGKNGRLDSLQAAVVSVKLKHFPKEIALRQTAADIYTDILEGVVQTPHVMEYNKSTWAQYTIRVQNRDEVREALQAKGIPTAVHYPRIVPHQPAFSYLGNSQKYPHGEQAAQEVLSLPMHAFITRDEIEQVCSAVKDVMGV